MALYKPDWVSHFNFVHQKIENHLIFNVLNDKAFFVSEVLIIFIPWNLKRKLIEPFHKKVNQIY